MPHLLGPPRLPRLQCFAVLCSALHRHSLTFTHSRTALGQVGNTGAIMIAITQTRRAMAVRGWSSVGVRTDVQPLAVTGATCHSLPLLVPNTTRLTMPHYCPTMCVAVYATHSDSSGSHTRAGTTLADNAHASCSTQCWLWGWFGCPSGTRQCALAQLCCNTNW